MWVETRCCTGHFSFPACKWARIGFITVICFTAGISSTTYWNWLHYWNWLLQSKSLRHEIVTALNWKMELALSLELNKPMESDPQMDLVTIWIQIQLRMNWNYNHKIWKKCCKSESGTGIMNNSSSLKPLPHWDVRVRVCLPIWPD